MNNLPSENARASVGLVDYREIIARYSVEELNAYADEYYRSIQDPTYQLAKPFNLNPESVPALKRFTAIMEGLQLASGMRVLDLGCGTCWTSKILAQLGCHVVCSDVSPYALELGKRLFHEQPVIGDRPAPEFRLFDGKRIPGDDGEFDRILLFDVFHHLPDKEGICRELCRVLAPDGLAAFAEPGPNHSRFPTAQSEMRNFVVIESDIVIEDIWKWARSAGFDDIRLSLLMPENLFLTFENFVGFMQGKPLGLDASVRNHMQTHRLFFLSRGEFEKRHTSRWPDGLRAKISGSTKIEQGILKGVLKIENVGSARWLNAPGPGQVNLGCHQLSRDGKLVNLDLMRFPLASDVEPGAVVEMSVSMPVSPNCIVEFDMVAEHVAWFENVGSPTLRFVIP